MTDGLIAEPATWIATACIGMSLITFFTCAMDKATARAGRWRISAACLHWLSLSCGWPGALLAQQRRSSPQWSEAAKLYAANQIP